MSGQPLQPEACRLLRDRLASADPLTGPALSSAQVEHLAACDSCRRAVADEDPAALFSALVFERKDEAFWTGFETRVFAGIREEQRKRPGIFAWARPRSLTLAGASAAIAILALALVTGGGNRVGEGGAVAHGPHPGSGPASAHELIAKAAMPMLPLQPDSAAEPSPVESVSSATARIISIRVDGQPGADAHGQRPGPEPVPAGAAPGREDSDVVLIVDQRIDL